jgi:hypothetical protein
MRLFISPSRIAIKKADHDEPLVIAIRKKSSAASVASGFAIDMTGSKASTAGTALAESAVGLQRNSTHIHPFIRGHRTCLPPAPALLLALSTACRSS